MTGPVRILISGASGRMGRTVARLAGDDPTFQLVGGLDRGPDGTPDAPATATPGTAGPLLAEADAIVDFSAPAFLRDLLGAHASAKSRAALVIGTTGLEPGDEELLDETARRVPVLTAANFSVGVNLLLALAETAAAALPGFDLEVVEAHHRRKEDAPSGTALALGEALARGRGVDLAEVRQDGRSGRPGARPAGEIAFHALRGGDVIGDHTVHLIGDLERIELTHRASDRSLFAAGALRAARWLHGRGAGRYTMREVLDL